MYQVLEVYVVVEMLIVRQFVQVDVGSVVFVCQCGGVGDMYWVVEIFVGGIFDQYVCIVVGMCLDYGVVVGDIVVYDVVGELWVQVFGSDDGGGSGKGGWCG